MRGVIVGVLLGAVGSAASAAALPDRVLRCATEKDDARRLACYDTEIARLGAGPSAASAGAAPAKPAVAVEDDFGRRGDLRPKEERIEPSEVSGSVAAFTRGPDGRLVVTLQNGQVWREITPNSAVRLEPGDAVRIERGSLGSFLLIAPNKRSTKVTRIK